MNKTCSVCGGPVSDRNASGICTKTFECRSALQTHRHGKKPSGNRKSQRILPIVYDLDTNEEIIDDIAIRIAFEGVRIVSLTITERKIVIEKMIQAGYQFREIANHIGTSPPKLKPLFEELGYELIPRRTPGSAGHEATQIRKRSDQPV